MVSISMLYGILIPNCLTYLTDGPNDDYHKFCGLNVQHKNGVPVELSQFNCQYAQPQGRDREGQGKK